MRDEFVKVFMFDKFVEVVDEVEVFFIRYCVESIIWINIFMVDVEFGEFVIFVKFFDGFF